MHYAPQPFCVLQPTAPTAAPPPRVQMLNPHPHISNPLPLGSSRVHPVRFR